MTIPVYLSGSDISFDHFNRVAQLRPSITFEYNVMNGDLGQMCETLNHDAIALVSAASLPYPLPESLIVVALLPSSQKGDVGQPFASCVAVIALQGNEQAGQLFVSFDERRKWGQVFIAGFGPGDIGLVTRKVDASLATCDVIIYDDLIDADYLNAFTAQKIYAGKRKGKHHVSQDEINELIYTNAVAGKTVVRLKGGDPLIFGRGAEEYHYLAQRHIRATIIPGISSALAAAASGIVPLTARGVSSSVAFLSGHDLAKLVIPQADTLVFYMGASNQHELSLRLQSEGWGADVPAVVIRNASLPEMQMRRYTLASLATDEHPLGSPSIIIVGYSTAADPKALPKKWLYTGIHAEDFKEEGQCVHSPMIAIEPLQLTDADKQKLINIRQYQTILFASRHSVEHFFKQLFALGFDGRHLNGIRIISIGENTKAALQRVGILPDQSIADCISDEVMEWFQLHPITQQHILIPKPACGIAGLPEWLINNGNKVDALVLYNVVMPDSIIKHNLDGFHGVVFTSPSTLDHFMTTYGHLPQHLKVKGRGCTRVMMER